MKTIKVQSLFLSSLLLLSTASFNAHAASSERAFKGRLVISERLDRAKSNPKRKEVKGDCELSTGQNAAFFSYRYIENGQEVRNTVTMGALKSGPRSGITAKSIYALMNEKQANLNITSDSSDSSKYDEKLAYIVPMDDMRNYAYNFSYKSDAQGNPTEMAYWDYFMIDGIDRTDVMSLSQKFILCTDLRAK